MHARTHTLPLQSCPGRYAACFWSYSIHCTPRDVKHLFVELRSMRMRFAQLSSGKDQSICTEMCTNSSVKLLANRNIAVPQVFSTKQTCGNQGPNSIYWAYHTHRLQSMVEPVRDLQIVYEELLPCGRCWGLTISARIFL